MNADILVTGATGFIGGRLAEILLDRGQAVRLLVRDQSRLSNVLRSSAEIIGGDLGDMESLKAATRDTKTIYHCAGNVSTWGPWDSYYQANVQGVENLLNAITTVNNELPRLIHLSSVDVYGFPLEPCDETAALADGGYYYGKSKILAEYLIGNHGRTFGLPYTILRPCNVIGPGSQFIGRIGKKLQAGTMLTVSGGQANAGLVYIDNLVGYMLWAASSPDTLGECYNIRDDYDVSWKIFLDSFRERINGKGRVVNLPFPVADAIAALSETIHKGLPIDKEPPLHSLIVRIFGRTCGHSSKKIIDACGGAMNLGFDEAMNRSCQWFLDC
jgi:nucleoside-diphosphate-sugar epimerase